MTGTPDPEKELLEVEYEVKNNRLIIYQQDDTGKEERTPVPSFGKDLATTRGLEAAVRIFINVTSMTRENTSGFDYIARDRHSDKEYSGTIEPFQLP